MQTRPNQLSVGDGLVFLSASEALIKGTLESDTPVAMIAGPRREPFAAFFRTAATQENSDLLRAHGSRTVVTGDAGRALILAHRVAAGGESAMALVANRHLDRSMGVLARISRRSMPASGALVVIIEDQPAKPGSSSPIHTAERLELAVLIPGDLDDLRRSVDHAIRLSRAAGRPVIVSVHGTVLRSADTILARPNRVERTVDLVAPGTRRRLSRVSEIGGPLRVARRLELNPIVNPPGPGEKVATGLIAVGPAIRTIRHVLDEVGLVGRVPILELRLVRPLDHTLVGRFLQRCENVVVLEPEPGVVESMMLELAEGMRRSGEKTAMIWGRELPVEADEDSKQMQVNDVLHASILVRRILGLLHAIRPTLRVRDHLVPPTADAPRSTDLRESRVGTAALLATLRHDIAEVQERLDEPATDDGEQHAPVRLLLDREAGSQLDDAAVSVEIWTHRRFVEEGIGALVQAARSDARWIFLVCEQSADDVADLERLARSVVPAERADRVRVDTANLDNRDAFRERFEEAVHAGGMTVLIVRDGPPARFDIGLLDRSLAEVDRLGFRPVQMVTWAVEEACDFEVTSRGIEAEQPFTPDSRLLETSMSAERSGRRRRRRIDFRVQPLLGQIEVRRERPPALRQRSISATRLPSVEPLHARQSSWRAHLAGFRSEAPGPAARILCEAGRIMGYVVRSLHDPTPIGAGYRAWAQVLFTRPRRGETPGPEIAATPYGEADLLLGLEPHEVRRAISDHPSFRVAYPSKTHLVLNYGSLQNPPGGAASESERDRLEAEVAPMVASDPRFIQDVTAASRAWFHTDRLTDILLLGVAYQLGLIPVNQSSIEAAVQRVAATGYGRFMDAFHLGRTLAVERETPSPDRGRRPESLERYQARIRRTLRWTDRRAGTRADRLDEVLIRSVRAMPGLTETDRGRRALMEFGVAVSRCMTWGGGDYAQRYADLIVSLYRSDRGDRGRELTRLAIRPLAEALLIRDPFYVSAVATGPEQRARVRQMLNVKHARGDVIDQRYLTRAELQVGDRLMRVDLRTSDWPALLLSRIRPFIPHSWRGDRNARAVRAYISSIVSRATVASPETYDDWVRTLKTVDDLARQSRLRRMPEASIRRLIEPEGEADAAMEPAART